MGNFNDTCCSISACCNVKEDNWNADIEIPQKMRTLSHENFFATIDQRPTHKQAKIYLQPFETCDPNEFFRDTLAKLFGKELD